jgi:hypothetical protein
MADKSERVPKGAMNAPATGQFPYRLNEPLALLCQARKDEKDKKDTAAPRQKWVGFSKAWLGVQRAGESKATPDAKAGVARARRRAFDLIIPCWVASPQSPTLFHQVRWTVPGRAGPGKMATDQEVMPGAALVGGRAHRQVFADQHERRPTWQWFAPDRATQYGSKPRGGDAGHVERAAAQLTPTCSPDGGVRGLTGAGRNRQMAYKGEGVPAKAHERPGNGAVPVSLE